MTDIPDFTTEELKIVQESVDERYGHSTEPQLADAEIRPDQSTRELIEVPAVFRAERDANFVIVKVEKNSAHSFSTAVTSNLAPIIRYSMTLGLCVITSLQVQADLETKEAKQAE